jgi:methylated-DNA-[protein]-cysteine S-methyltransferase
MDFHFAYYSSPIGLIEISGNEDGIATLYFVDERKHTSSKIHPSLKESIMQLEEYFKGLRKGFGLKLNPKGTDFQKKVWDKLLTLPFGRTVSYLDISKMLGDANATRAVGNANGSNPISIIVPCHRVIGVNGKLVGYGGGLWRKEWLLNHEKSITFGKQTTLFNL